VGAGVGTGTGVASITGAGVLTGAGTAEPPGAPAELPEEGNICFRTGEIIIKERIKASATKKYPIIFFIFFILSPYFRLSFTDE
jgi:hypothetical protein